MTESIVVKQIGTESIMLKEAVERSMSAYALVCIGMLYFAIVSGMSLLVGSFSKAPTGMADLQFCLFVGALVTVILSVMLHREVLPHNEIPSYNVWIKGEYFDHYELIVKTSPESDQKEICKAVRKLTCILRERELVRTAKETELKAIAEKCR